jgi:hypothetical protein
MRAFWPVGEAAQAEYESLRAGALGGIASSTPAWLRFQRHGLVALIAAPVSGPVFSAVVVGVSRPPWSPHGDPRLDVLVAGYELVLAVGSPTTRASEVQR